jgi:hypothetical protein
MKRAIVCAGARKRGLQLLQRARSVKTSLGCARKQVLSLGIARFGARRQQRRSSPPRSWRFRILGDSKLEVWRIE